MSPIRVLLVEDDTSYAGLVRRQLATGLIDSELRHATSLLEAIAALQSESFDIVLLDLSLPDSWGVSGVHRLQEHSGKVPIVVLTGNEDEIQAIDAINSGAQDYLSKSDLEPRLLARCMRYAIERKKAESKAREQERFLRAVLDGIDASICILDSSGTIVATNEAWRRSARAEGASLNFAQIGSNYLEYCHHVIGHDSKAASRIVDAVESICTGSLDSFVTEYVCVTADQESWFQVRLSPVFGVPHGSVVVAHIDISDRVLTRRRLEDVTEEAETLALVAKHTDNAVIITNAFDHIEWVNDGFTHIYGYTMAEVQGLELAQLLHGPETDPITAESIRCAVATQRGFDIEIAHYSKEGGRLWAAVEMRPIVGPHGQIDRRVTIIRDITLRRQAESEREQLQQQLLESSRRAGMAETATCVLHNVGNVLNSVNVTTHLLSSRLRESRIGRLKQAADLLGQQGNNLRSYLSDNPQGKLIPMFFQTLATHLIAERDDMLGELESLQSHVEHMKEIVTMQQSLATSTGLVQECELIGIIEDAIRVNEAGLKRHQIQILKQFYAKPIVCTQKHKLLQILINLISNAKHAISDSPRGTGPLTIRVEMRDDRARIEVEDKGVGIPHENLSRIFEMGFTTRKQGHGFGLHGSANTAKEIGATLSAKSEGLGHGAVFILELPLQANESFQCSILATTFAES